MSWISLKTRVPSEGKEVLITDLKSVAFGEIVRDKKNRAHWVKPANMGVIKYWMHKPMPPQEGEEKKDWEEQEIEKFLKGFAP